MMKTEKLTVIALAIVAAVTAFAVGSASTHAAVVVTWQGTPTVVDNGSSTYTFSNWSLFGGNAVAVLFSGENAQQLTATYGGQAMTVVEAAPTSNRWVASIAYLINPNVSTGDLVLSYTDTGGNETLYTPLSLGNVGSVAASQATDSGNMNFNYTTAADGGLVLGVSTNNDWNGATQLTVTGNPDTILWQAATSGNFGALHAYGDVPFANSYTDVYLKANAVASVVFETGAVPEPASLALLGLGGLMIARRR